MFLVNRVFRIFWVFSPGHQWIFLYYKPTTVFSDAMFVGLVLFFPCSISLSLSCRAVPNICSVPLSIYSLYWLQSCGSSTPSTFSLELHKEVQFHRHNNSVSCWLLLFQSSYIRMRLDWNRSQPESIPTISPAIRTTCWELSNGWVLGERNYRHKNKIKYTLVLIQHFKAYL